MTRPFRFLHAADIHLDSALKGLAHYQGAPESVVKHATRTALERMVDLALQQEVDFVVIAGDLYDGAWPDQSTGLYFSQQMSRLRGQSIPVFVIRGNHDAASRVTDRLRLPENVTLLPPGQVSRCESDVLDRLGVVIYGHSYETPAVMDSVIDQFPMAKPDQFTIGILHTAVEGNQQHQRYAPCSIGDLTSRGYDYWALGHVHQRQWLSSDPPIVFSGNLQGRHIRETGAKGCYVVDVDETRKCHTTFHSTDLVRWLDLELVLSGSDYNSAIDQMHRSLRDIIDQQFWGKPDDQEHASVEDPAPLASGKAVIHSAEALALRIHLLLDSELYGLFQRRSNSVVADLRSFLTDVSAGRVWLERVKYKIASGAANLDHDGGPMKLLRSLARDSEGDPELLNRCRNVVNELCVKLPTEIVESLDSLRTDDSKLSQRIQQLPEVIFSADSSD